MDLVKTTQSLTTAADMRETTKMLMQPNANWGEYLTPAPLSIAIMGELVFISSDVKNDFSINKNAPKNGFQYITHPDSFRACLMQICNSGWHAFNEAHKNMDQIRIYTASVPDYMKEAVNILFNAPDEVIHNLLPNQLKNISDIANDCLTLAEGVQKKYMDVINLIQELLVACINAEYLHGEELENIKMKIEETKLKEMTSKQLNERTQKATEDMGKHIEEAQNEYKKAMDSIPSGWEMVSMNVFEGLTKVVTGMISGGAMMGIFGGALGGGIGAGIGGVLAGIGIAGGIPAVGAGIGCAVSGIISVSGIHAGGDGRSGGSPEQSHFEKPIDTACSDMAILSSSDQILGIIGLLTQNVSEDEIDWKELYDQKNKTVKSEWTKDRFETLSQGFEKKPDSKARKNALSLVKRGIDICKVLATYKPDQRWDGKKTKQVIEDLQKLKDDAQAFDCSSKKSQGSPALAAKLPMMFKAQTNSLGVKSAGQVASENARFRIEQSREQLKQAREQYNKCVENMKKNEKELTEILCELQNCDVKKVDFETTIKMLVKGMHAMGMVKEQWEKMVRFFQMVSNIIKTSLHRTLKSFVETADDNKSLAYNGKLFSKDLLYKLVFEASNIASLVHIISSTYTEVSSKYLMDRVSSLGRLMAMDKSSEDFKKERKVLQDSCDEAQKGILQLVLKNKEEFEKKTDARMAKIEGSLKAILPDAAPEQTERLKGIVKAGFSVEPLSDNDIKQWC